MVRDARMQELVAKASEPLNPFVDLVRSLADDHGVSTVLVVGSSGDYLDVADRVLLLESYRCTDVTQRAREVAARPTGRVAEAGTFPPVRGRVPTPAASTPPPADAGACPPSAPTPCAWGSRTSTCGPSGSSPTGQVTGAGLALDHAVAAGHLDGGRTLAEVLDRLDADLTRPTAEWTDGRPRTSRSRAARGGGGAEPAADPARARPALNAGAGERIPDPNGAASPGGSGRCLVGEPRHTSVAARVVAAVAVLTVLAAVLSGTGTARHVLLCVAQAAAIAVLLLTGRREASVWRWWAAAVAVLSVASVVGAVTDSWPGPLQGVTVVAAAPLVYGGLVRWNRFRTYVSDPGDWLNGLSAVLALTAAGLVAQQWFGILPPTWPTIGVQLWMLTVACLVILLGTCAAVAVIGGLVRDPRMWLVLLTLAGLIVLSTGLRGHGPAEVEGARALTGWTRRCVAVAVASTLPRRTTPVAATSQAPAIGALVVLAVAVTALGLDTHRGGWTVSWYAVAAILGISVRMVHLVRELAHLAESRQQALTDELNGTGNAAPCCASSTSSSRTAGPPRCSAGRRPLQGGQRPPRPPRRRRPPAPRRRGRPERAAGRRRPDAHRRRRVRRPAAGPRRVPGRPHRARRHAGRRRRGRDRHLRGRPVQPGRRPSTPTACCARRTPPCTRPRPPAAGGVSVYDSEVGRAAARNAPVSPTRCAGSSAPATAG